MWASPTCQEQSIRRMFEVICWVCRQSLEHKICFFLVTVGFSWDTRAGTLVKIPTSCLYRETPFPMGKTGIQTTKSDRREKKVRFSLNYELLREPSACFSRSQSGSLKTQNLWKKSQKSINQTEDLLSVHFFMWENLNKRIQNITWMQTNSSTSSCIEMSKKKIEEKDKADSVIFLTRLCFFSWIQIFQVEADWNWFHTMDPWSLMWKYWSWQNAGNSSPTSSSNSSVIPQIQKAEVRTFLLSSTDPLTPSEGSVQPLLVHPLTGPPPCWSSAFYSQQHHCLW